MTLHTPTSEPEACQIVADAAARRAPLALQGSGTKADLGRPAQAEATLSSAGLTGVTLYEPAELVIGAQAGTPLREVVATLAARGQELPFEPMDHRVLLGSTGEPTIGAVAAGNISGPRRILSGAARDSLLGVRFINGRGEAIKSGGRVMKNVTGLDLVKLMAGSWGTLGFLTEVTFKVQPKPERIASLSFSGLSDARAVEALCTAAASPFEVTGAAHLPGDRTIIRIEGFATSITYRLGQLRRVLKAFGTPDVIEGEAAAELWRGIRDGAPLVEPRDHAVWRISTTPTMGPGLVEAIADAIETRCYYDWSGGLVWLATPATGDAGAAAIRGALARAGGHATLVRAPVEVRAAIDVFQPLSEPLMRVSAGVKASLDPAGIFNPGRMYAGV